MVEWPASQRTDQIVAQRTNMAELSHKCALCKPNVAAGWPHAGCRVNPNMTGVEDGIEAAGKLQAAQRRNTTLTLEADMRVTLERLTQERLAPGEAAVAVTIVNDGDRPTPFHEHRAQRASLVLQVEDPSGRRVLLPPPSPPDEQDLAPVRPLAPGESVTLRYVGFLDTYATGGRYRVRWFSPHDDLGGTRESPLASDWITLDVAHHDIRVEARPSFSDLLL